MIEIPDDLRQALTRRCGPEAESAPADRPVRAVDFAAGVRPTDIVLGAKVLLSGLTFEPAGWCCGASSIEAWG